MDIIRTEARIDCLRNYATPQRSHKEKRCILASRTVKKKGPRGVRFEGCYSPGSVMATHKGVELTSWGVGRLR